MRILFISAEFPPDVGGVGDYSRRLALALVDRGHDVAVLTGRYGLIEFRAEDKHAGDEKVAQGKSGTLEPETWNLKPGSETRVQTRRRRVPTKLETWSLRPVEAALGAFRPDIVHLQYQTGAYGMHPAVLLLPARLRRLRRDIPVLVTAHDLRLPYLFPRADLLRGWLTGRLLDDAGAVIVTNQDDAGRLAGLAPPSRELYSPRRPLNAQPIIIPIGSNIQPAPPAAYDRTAQRAATGAGPESVQIAYFGLLSRTKGVLELLQALAGLPPRFRLLIVGGSAPLPDDLRFAVDVNAAIAEHGIGERVTITGPLSEPDVSGHLLACDIAALPYADGASYRRGSLLAVLAHGLPVITTQPPAQLDPPLRDGAHVLLLPPADVGALRAAIERLAGDGQLRKTLSAGGLELVAGFAWPAIADRHESVYHAVLSSRR